MRPDPAGYLDWVAAAVFDMLPPGNRRVHRKVGLPVAIAIHG